MARFMLLVALCLLPALLTVARPVANPYLVTGRVYCDTCRVGFETPATTYIHGAKVRLECRNRYTQELLYRAEATTDETGTYQIWVKEDQGNSLCETMLAGSPLNGCGKADPGRDRSHVVLTSFNGMTSNTRYANNLGFMKDTPLAACAQVLQQYELTEDEV